MQGLKEEMLKEILRVLRITLLASIVFLLAGINLIRAEVTPDIQTKAITNNYNTIPEQFSCLLTQVSNI